MTVFQTELKRRELANISNEDKRQEIEVMKELRYIIQTMKVAGQLETELKVYYCGAVVKMKITLESDQLGGWA